VTFGSDSDANHSHAGMVSEQEAKRVETLVNEALVEKQGNAAAFSRFRTSNSKRWFGHAYVFACDQKLGVFRPDVRG